MRLEPLEKPRSLILRLAYWGMRRQMGKVMTPVKVLTARMPGSLKLTNAIVKYESKKIRIDRELHYLIVAMTSQINGCSFCSDLARYMAMKDRIGLEKFDALSDYATNSLYTLREKAALAYVTEITRYRKVSNSTFERLREYFKDWEIAEITWLNALENYYNLINIPLEIGSDGFCSVALSKETGDLYAAKGESGK